MSISYRESHLTKGNEYQSTFSELPYRRLMWRMERRALDQILGSIATARMRYLDFACGTGRVLSHLEARFESSTGVDVSESMLVVARQSVTKARVVQGDLTRQEFFRPSSFDVVTAFRFFPNAENALRHGVLSVLSRLLRPNGRLVFNNHRNVESLRNSIKSRVGHGVVTGMTHAEVQRLIAPHGFIIERALPIGYWPGSEFNRRMPLTMLQAAEWLAAALRPPMRWSNNVLYVCRHS